MKKLFSIIAAALVAVPAVVNASEPWDGTTKTQPNLVENVYQVSNGEELAWISDYVNAGNREINFVLTDDIDLNNMKFEPIGNVKKTWFKGNFDGQNHVITGLYIEAHATTTTADDWNLGLFGGTANAAQTLANVTVTGRVYVPASQTLATNGGIFIGKSDALGTVSNVHSDGVVEVDGALAYVGGLLGFKKEGTLKSCSFSGEIIINGNITKGVGGILGTTNSSADNKTAVIDGCVYSGKMMGDGTITSYSGGIEGYNNFYHKNTEGSTLAYVKNCLVIGSVKITTSGASNGILYGSVSKSGTYYKRTNNSYFDIDNNVCTEKEVPAGMLHRKGADKAWSAMTEEAIHSGESCYVINSKAGEMIFGQDLTDPTSVPTTLTENNKVFRLTLMTKPEEPNRVSGPVYAEEQEEPDTDPYASYVESGVAYTNPALRLPVAPEGYVWTDRNGVAYASDAKIDSDTTIYATPQTLGVDTLNADDVNVEYFNLQGRRVANPGHGLYIRRTATGTVKVNL